MSKENVTDYNKIQSYQIAIDGFINSTAQCEKCGSKRISPFDSEPILADLEKYRKFKSWTIAQIVSLSFGLNPESKYLLRLLNCGKAQHLKHTNAEIFEIHSPADSDILKEFDKANKDLQELLENHYDNSTTSSKKATGAVEIKIERIERNEAIATVEGLGYYFPKELKGHSELENKNSQYSTPYLELLKKAIRELEITNEGYIASKDVATWLIDNWNEKVPLSKKIASSMATMLRPLEAKKGGYNKKLKAVPKKS